MGGKNLHQASTVKPPKDEDVSDDDIKVRKVWMKCLKNVTRSPCTRLLYKYLKGMKDDKYLKSYTLCTRSSLTMAAAMVKHRSLEHILAGQLTWLFFIQ